MKTYGTFWLRFCAATIDSAIFVPIAWLNIMLVSNQVLPVFLYILWAFLTIFMAIGYRIILHWKYGKTVGKYLLGMKVMDLSGKPLSLKQSILRDLPFVICMPHAIYSSMMGYSAIVSDLELGTSELDMTFLLIFNGWCFLVAVTILLDSQARGIHDVIASTVVIREKNEVTIQPFE